MKVFISWSGDRGKAVAKALAQWLPTLFEGLDVFYSPRDITAGSAWLPKLFEGLKQCDVGVLCLTPENQTSPWMLFEAGAVWRGMEDARIIPYCHDLDPASLGEPLKNIQGVADTWHGTWSLVRSLNKCRPKPRPDAELQAVFEALWPGLEKTLAKVPLPPEEAGKGGVCARITGTWWERIRPDRSSALSFVTVEPDPNTGTVHLAGRAYSLRGRQMARWESLAACVDEAKRKVFYYWKGSIATQDGTEDYNGFAELTFEPCRGPWTRASGFFSDTNMRDMKRTTKKSVELYRCQDGDAEIMSGSDAGVISKLIRERANSLN